MGVMVVMMVVFLAFVPAHMGLGGDHHAGQQTQESHQHKEAAVEGQPSNHETTQTIK